MTMLRAHTIKRRTIEFREDKIPELTPGHALVRVQHVALCGTDLHIWDDDYPTELPLVQGHEFVGIVEAINHGPAETQGRTQLSVGTPVAVSPMVYCNACGPCRAGRYNVCESISCLGCYEDGALAEVVSVPVDKLHVLPEGMPMRLAVLGEPGSIAMHAVNRGTPVAGETALVLGCGPIGLLATLFLTERGVKVIASDLSAARLELASAFGAVATLKAGSGEFLTPSNKPSSMAGARSRALHWSSRPPVSQSRSKTPSTWPPPLHASCRSASPRQPQRCP
ncbi:alcohol dehydrogenase catalytic domain-containing protein [Arthrobacter alpinus]|nr:alcohol dehydrogenase catalytic domain-containing protein [Arthrobacter alpinus]